MLGRVSRAEVYEKGFNFRVAHVFLFDSTGRMLIHKLADTKRNAGSWGSSAAGAVRAGETPRAAARRELREELGLGRVPLKGLGRVRVQDNGVTKFVYLFAGLDPGLPIRPDPREIEAVEYLDLEELRNIVRQRERSFTPTFVSAFSAYERSVVS